MSILDQSDIDALLATAGAAKQPAGPEKSRPAAPAPRNPRRPVQLDPAELRRILHIRFPVIVTLAERKLPFGDLLKLTPGSIIEFDRASDSEPDLFVGNCRIGRGQAVKVGEYFGLRITEVDPVEARIRAMGK